MRLPLFILLLLVSFSASAQLQQIITTSPGSTARQAYTISNANDVYINNRVDSVRDNMGAGGASWPLSGSATLTGGVTINGGNNPVILGGGDPLSLFYVNPSGNINLLAQGENLLSAQGGGTFVWMNNAGDLLLSSSATKLLNLSQDDALGQVLVKDPTTQQIFFRDAATIGGISDGDKGDVSVTGGGTAITIDDQAVTFAKMQNVTLNRLIGRATGFGAGVPGEISASNGITLGSNAIKFGGSLTGPTSLAGGGFDLNFSAFDDLIFGSTTFSVSSTGAIQLSGGSISSIGKHTFTPSATVAGLNLGSFAGDPSSLTNGDLWYNSSSTILRARVNGVTRTIPTGTAGGGNEVIFSSSNNVIASAAGFTFAASTLTTPNLTVTTAPTLDNTLTQIIARDATTGAIKRRDVSTIGVETASNGLTKTVNDIKLGGTVTAATSITLPSNLDNAFDFKWTDVTNATNYFARFSTFEEDFFTGIGPGITFGSDNENGGPFLLKATHQPTGSAWFDDLTYVTKKYVDDQAVTAGSGLNEFPANTIKLGGAVTETATFTPSVNSTYNLLFGSNSGNQFANIYRRSQRIIDFVDAEDTNVNDSYQMQGVAGKILVDVDNDAVMGFTATATNSGFRAFANPGTRQFTISPTGLYSRQGEALDFSEILQDKDRTALWVDGSQILNASLTGVDVKTLNITDAPANDNALTSILVRDAGTGVIKYRTVASLPGGGGGTTETASNGLNKVVDDIQLGGALTGDVLINGAHELDISIDLLSLQATGGAELLSGADLTLGANGVININAGTTVSVTGTAVLPATTSIGTVSNTEIGYLDNVTSAIQTQFTNKQPLDSDLTAFAALTPSNDDIAQRKAGAWTNRTPAQLKTDLVLVKGDVGLGNVDNTSDVNKPVSTAQQAAIDAKANQYTARLILASNVSTAANTTPVNLTGMVFTYEANSTYKIDMYMVVQAPVATTGHGFGLDASTAPTLVSLGGTVGIALAGGSNSWQAIADNAIAGVVSAVPTAATNTPSNGGGVLVTGGSTGTCQFIFRSEVAAVTTCMASSIILVTKMN